MSIKEKSENLVHKNLISILMGELKSDSEGAFESATGDILRLNPAKWNYRKEAEAYAKVIEYLVKKGILKYA